MISTMKLLRLFALPPPPPDRVVTLRKAFHPEESRTPEACRRQKLIISPSPESIEKTIMGYGGTANIMAAIPERKELDARVMSQGLVGSCRHWVGLSVKQVI